MRIANFAPVFVIGIALGWSQALSLDGTRVPSDSPLSPVEAFRNGTAAYRTGEKDKAILALQYAADNGHTLAQWKLGRMYAAGDMVPQDAIQAFEYFRRIINSHADESPGTQQARVVAGAFVALGRYYLDGIPNSAIVQDPERAREMFSYAASYFGDPQAQYELARLYLRGIGAPIDPRLAARWFFLAANKGQYEAQAALGEMLFKGDRVPRRAALGLMWLTLARDAAANEETWITNLYDTAIAQATDEERNKALRLLEDRLKRRP
jgi:TPR repeat protein